MFRKKAAQTGGETLMGRRAILHLRDRFVKQYTLEPQVGDLMLGRRKKTDLRVTATKFERSVIERGVVYRVDFEDASNFVLNAPKLYNSVSIAAENLNGTQETNEAMSLEGQKDYKEGAEHHSSETGSFLTLERGYCPNMLNLKSLPTTLPWLFELNMDRLFPTMHLLWIHGSLILIPSLIILRNAKQFIFNGADLMAGGVIFEATKNITGIKKDQIWTIKCAGDSLPIAIGVSLVDWDDISDPSMRKGKVLRVIHHCKDALSSEGNMDFNERPNTNQEKEANLDDNKSTAASEVIESFESMKLERDLVLEASQDLSSLDEGEPQVPGNELTSESDPAVSHVSDDSRNKKQCGELSQETYDLLLETLLLKVISEYSSNKSTLPANSSAIWDKISRLCLQSYGIQVDIRKSSFVKVQKFFQFYSKKNILTIKQGRGGVLNIVDVSDEEVKRLEKLNEGNEVTLKLPPIVKKKPKAHCSTGENKLSKTNPPKIEVVTLYQAEQNFSPILDYYNSKETSRLGRSFSVKTSRGEKEQMFISILDAKTAFEYYINSNNLKMSDVNPNQKEKPSNIVLDEVLEKLFHNHLGGNSIKSDKKVIPISLAYKEIPSFLKVFHYIRGESDSSSEEKPNIFKGPCKTIEIYTESRMGARKHVTVISPSISHFNLDPHEVAESCQKKFASSATVSQIKKYPSDNNLGIIIQGNVASQISDFLNSRWGIPKSYIQQS